MKAWTEDLVTGISRAHGVDDLFAQICKSARSLGFERCAYGLRRPSPFTRPRIFLLNDYDPRWRRRYEEAGYLAVDPTVLHATRSLTPIVWSDALFCETPALWAEARSFGLCVGWAQSCFDADGSVGLLSLSRSHERLTEKELRAKDLPLRWLVNVAQIALSSALTAIASGEPPRLTRREREVMQWTADGKTSLEVGDILGISVDTVNFHVNNVLVKLGTANKTAAVARLAVRLFH
ncbi:autoinducer binding domain-containing protein [Variovorax sp. LjRoot290]|uniref:autoinducer binding domain-containing protein n=1 Tax=Variovorax sp. LjRoot290 TaxID=3342316 RepID=UPI003ECEC1A8